MRAPLARPRALAGRRALLLLGALALGGCMKEFDPASFLDKLRVLAIVADQPELRSGETTTLTLHYYVPAGKPAPTLTWDACLLPPSPETGGRINPACTGNDMGAPLVHLPSSGLQATVTMPTFASVPEALAALGLPDSSNGLYLPVRLILTSGDQQLIAFYRVRWHFDLPPPLVSNAPNHNPTGLHMFQVPIGDAGMAEQTQIDDAMPPPTAPAVHANDKIYLRAAFDPSSSEPYVIYDSFPPMGAPRMVNESVKVSWYTTAGSFSDDVTGMEKPDTTLTLDKHLPASGTPIDLYTVAQDERGGTVIQHAQLAFQ